MILVDSGIWIDHFRAPIRELIRIQTDQTLASHPLVICELALGSLRNRDRILEYLGELPSPPTAANNEVLALIENRQLWGRGVGVVDANLVASVLLDARFSLWTRDRRLHQVATELGVAHAEH